MAHLLPNLFVLDDNGQVLIEKHFVSRKAPRRQVVELFREFWSKAPRPEEVLPVLETPRHILVHSRRSGLTLLTALEEDVPALGVLSVHARVFLVFSRYFSRLGPRVVKDNFALVLYILDEMAEGGYPFTMEPNQIEAMIPRPSLLGRIQSMFSSDGKVRVGIAQGILSKVPWRRADAKYRINQITFDIEETIDCVMDRQGTLSRCELLGRVRCRSRLTGTPDVRLTFSRPSLVADATLHRCVRIALFHNERVASFVPPDGEFLLLTYHLRGRAELPIVVRPELKVDPGRCRLRIVVRTSRGVDSVTGVRISAVFPRELVSSTVVSARGRFSTTIRKGEGSRAVVWVLKRLSARDEVEASGDVMFPPGFVLPGRPHLDIEFESNGWTGSGVEIDDVAVKNAEYKAYKGVKKATFSGRVQMRL